jgi:transcriptional regulator with XRE-family HTH domain
MAVPLQVRKENFAQWVKRITAHMKLTRNMSVEKIAEAAGIGDNTIYRWRNGDWGARGPQPEQIVAFADACDVSPQEAFLILWPGKLDSAPAVEPLVIPDPDLLMLAQRIADPNVDEMEKWYIHQQLKQLLARPKVPTDRPGKVIPRRTSRG